MGLPRNDALQISETMYHLMQADNQEKSAVWYGSFLTNQSQTSGSSAAMAIAMIEDEIKNKSFWIDWVISLLEYADRKEY